MKRGRSLILIAGIVSVALAGCGPLAQITGSTIHQKCVWKAEDYFADPQVIALCRAIEANNIAEIDRLVAAGANVNAQGKGNMTPLLWAYPDNKLERFKRLLEHGADPNVIIQSDFNTRGYMSAGDSVTHMACKTEFPGYFDAVFAHEGDANLINSGTLKFKSTPLLLVIESGGPDIRSKVQTLLKLGADINYKNSLGATPVQTAIIRGGRFDLALLLLEAGANPRDYIIAEANSKLIHLVLEKERVKETWTPKQAADYKKLIAWLEAHGESLEAAKADEQRWASWSRSTGEYKRKMAAEVAERKKREARQKGKVQQVVPTEE